MKAATTLKNMDTSDKLSINKAKMGDITKPAGIVPEKQQEKQPQKAKKQQQNPKTPWAQLDELLTCTVCLDRYKNPKLLPCQHTFCMEPCLEGLIDPVNHIIKCPECCAEHYVPYNGVQSYPNNLTLMRFLEVQILASEMELEPECLYRKCVLCGKKAELLDCAHCEKEICKECKDTHTDLLKREIVRIMNQVKRGIARVSEAVSSIKKNASQLQHNCESVKEEVENTMRRFTKDLKLREDILINEIDLFLETENRCMRHLQENLEIEIRNVNSMSEEADSYIMDTNSPHDIELMNYKEQFIQGLEFLRSFNPDDDEFSKRLRFNVGSELELLHQYITRFGELHVNSTHFNRHISSAERMATKYLNDKQYDELLGFCRDLNYLESGDNGRQGYISDSDSYSQRPFRKEVDNLSRDSGSSYFRRPEVLYINNKTLTCRY